MSVPTLYVPSWSMVAAGGAGGGGGGGRGGPGGGGAGGSAIAVPAETQQPARASVAATIAALHGLTTEIVRGRATTAISSMRGTARRARPAHHSCGPVSSDDDTADTRPPLVTAPVADPSGGDRLVPGQHPRPLG